MDGCPSSRPVLAGQVLNQRAAQRHIEDLHAPTDSENGLVFLPKQLDQPKLVLIPQRVDLAQPQHRLLPKAAGRYVVSSGQQKAV